MKPMPRKITVAIPGLIPAKAVSDEFGHAASAERALLRRETALVPEG